MSYTLAIATDATRDLVVDALKGAADQRTRVASAAALTVANNKLEGRDVRSASVKVTSLLAQAAQLGQLATELAAQEAVAVVHRFPHPVTITKAEAGVALTPLEEHAIEVNADGTTDDLDEALIDTLDDGLSDAAHAAAELAGLTNAPLLDEEDPTLDTGATREDDDDPDTSATDALEEGMKP